MLAADELDVLTALESRRGRAEREQAVGAHRLALALDVQFSQCFERACVVDQAARDLTAALRAAGVTADRAFDQRSMKAQFKAADRSGARFAVVVGPDEVATGKVIVQHLRDSGEEQLPVDRANIVAHLRELLEK